MFYEKLTYLYLEIPKFTRELNELQNDYDRWLYAFKNLHRLREMPKELEQGIFRKLFELAEIAKMDEKERSIYEDSLKDYRDLKNAIDSSFNEGKDEGRKQEKIEIAKESLKQGLSIPVISSITGLTEEEIKRLKFLR